MSKIIIMLLLLSILNTTSASIVYPRYDVNEDGIVDKNDLILVGQYLNEIVSIPYPRYEINMDGLVDIRDITLVSQNVTINSTSPDPTVYAGWRSSAYGYQTASPPSYWVNVAKAMASKFPGSIPGGIWLVGETDGDPATGTLLYMPSTGSYPNIRFQGGDIAEPYLTAFDAAGVKVILQVEPMNANINTLIDVVMNSYKDHPSVIGFGVDIEWYKTCADGCKATATDVVSWNNKLHSINPNYTLMIKHFDESKLPTGIPTDILVICDDENNGDLNTLVTEHVAMENQYPNNSYGAQIGYPSDKNIWGSMSDPAKEVGLAVQTAIGRPISVFWVDFTITNVFPPLQYNSG